MYDLFTKIPKKLLLQLLQNAADAFSEEPVLCTFFLIYSLMLLNHKKFIIEDSFPNISVFDLEGNVVSTTRSYNPAQNFLLGCQEATKPLVSNSMTLLRRPLTNFNHSYATTMRLTQNILLKSARLSLKLTNSLIIASLPVLETTMNIVLPINSSVPTFNQFIVPYLNLFIFKNMELGDLSYNQNIIQLLPDDKFFNKVNAFISHLLVERPIFYQNKMIIAQAIEQDNLMIGLKRWHWLHLQNFLSEIQKINSSTQDEVNTSRLLNLSFKWLQTLYLDADNLPSAYRHDEARNMAGIVRGLIESTDVYMFEETPQITEELYIGSADGLKLTIFITDFISKQIIQDHQPLNLEILLKRTSDDVNISMKLVDAYLLNHEQTINHIINQTIYHAIIYFILVACISICLIASTINPLISISIVSSLIAIPIIASLYAIYAPNPLNKKPLKRSASELIRLARQRKITELQRDCELDSLLNNIGSIIIFYENLIIKILYGLIFATLLTCLVAFPLIFLGIHLLPVTIGLLTAMVIGLGLYAFLKNIPTFNDTHVNELVHKDANQIAEVENLNYPNYLSVEHLSNTFTVSFILFICTLLNDDQPLKNNLFKNYWFNTFISQLLPIHPLIGKAILESLHLWAALDDGTAEPGTHNKLRAIAQNVSNHLPRDTIFNKSIANIIDHIVELHSLERPPANFTDFIRTVLRHSIPYLPRLLAGTNQIQQNIENGLSIAYPELDQKTIKHFSENIQSFLISPSTDQTEWFAQFALGILALKDNIEQQRSRDDETLAYRRKWEEKIVTAARRILGEEYTNTIRENPILNIIQGFLEISQDAFYRKGRLSVKENQVRDLLIRYSIMVQDIKHTEDTQYQFVDHYQYCWNHIPKIYFPTILILGILLLTFTPLGFSLPIVATLLIGGLLLLPWITFNSHKITRVNEGSFDNLKDVANQSDQDIKRDAFLSPLLSNGFKSVSDIFTVARASLRQITTVTVVIGVAILLIIASTITAVNPFVVCAIALALISTIIFNTLYERYVSKPSFNEYEYQKPGQANSYLTSSFFKQQSSPSTLSVLPDFGDNSYTNNEEAEGIFVLPSHLR